MPRQPSRDLASSVDPPSLGFRYEIESSLGEGASAWIYRVRDTRDGAIRVAKVLKPAGASDPQTLKRFEDEYRVLREIQHPSVPEVYDYGWTEDRESRFIVMEYVEGETLDKYFREHPEDLWILLYELCEALSFIHSRSLLHQDIKPENILVKRTTVFGEELPLLVLMDFGLAFRRDAEMKVAMVGTPEYMAPEIIRGDVPLTRAVDYYSLGATLYELLAGRTPFVGSPREVFAGHLNSAIHFETERVEYAELYPHVYGLMGKDKMARLVAFEAFRKAVVGRMTGGIADLDNAYAAAAVNSIGHLGSDAHFGRAVAWVDRLVESTNSDLIAKEVKLLAPDADAIESDIKEIVAASQKSQGGDDTSVVSPVLFVDGASGSGKSHFLLRVEAEAKTSGVRCYRLGRDTDFHLLLRRDRLPQSSQAFPALWDKLEAEAGVGPVLLLWDDTDRVTGSEKDFMSYAAQRVRLQAGTKSGIALAIATSQRSEMEYDELGRIGGDRIAIEDVADGACEAAIEFTRERIDRGQRKELLALLRGQRNRSGFIVGALREAVGREVLSLSGNRWRFDSSKLPTLDLQSANADMELYRSLVSSEGHELMEWLSCHQGQLGVAVLADVCGHSRAHVEQIADRLRRKRIISVSFAGERQFLSIPNRKLQAGIYEGIAVDDARNRHKKFAERLRDSSDQSTPAVLALSRHLRLSGETRQSWRLIVEAVSSLSQFGDTDGQCELCAGVMEMLEEDRTDRGDETLLRRFVLRQWLRDELKRSNMHAIAAIYDRYLSDVRPFPAGFLTMTMRGLLEMSRWDDARTLVNRVKSESSHLSRSASVRVVLNEAAIETSRIRMPEADALLVTIESEIGCLTLYERCRFYVQRSIAYQSRSTTVLERAIVEAERLAKEGNYRWELVSVLGLKADMQFASIEYDRVLQHCIRGLRMARRSGIHRQTRTFYFVASAVYYERGDYQTALKYVKRAADVAIAHGDSMRAALYLTRMAMISLETGMLGNAFRYIRRAQQAHNPVEREHEYEKREIFTIHLLVESGSPSLVDWTSWRNRSENMEPDHKAYFFYLQGRDLFDKGDCVSALSYFERARNWYREGGYLDDEARSLIRMAESSVHISDSRVESSARYLAAALELSEKLSSETVRGEIILLQLSCAELRLNNRPVSEFISVAENFQLHTQSLLLRTRINRALFILKVKAGNVRGARDSFRLYYDDVRTMLSNFAGEGDVDAFLKRFEWRATLEKFKSTE